MRPIALLFACLTVLVLASAPAFAEETPEAYVHPVSEFEVGQAKFFTAKSGGKSIKYFVVKTADGRLRTAADACDVCYESKKGYSQKGEFMICNNCGMRFHITRVGDIKGGCNPHPLASSVEGDKLVIKKSSLAESERFF